MPCLAHIVEQQAGVRRALVHAQSAPARARLDRHCTTFSGFAKYGTRGALGYPREGSETLGAPNALFHCRLAHAGVSFKSLNLDGVSLGRDARSESGTIGRIRSGQSRVDREGGI